MRNTTTAIAAALAVLAAGAAPAMACEAYASPCGSGFYTPGAHYEVYESFEHLPVPPEPHVAGPLAPRYYYVNQGPTFTGPGMYAPVPTYQERAVTGWHGYDYGYYYGYNGGPYGDATSHYYDGMPPADGPVVYRYGRWGHRHHVHRLHYGAGAPVRHVAGAYAASGPQIIHVPHGAARD